MRTDVRNPQDVFFSPQRLLVPLFQRPYVWSLAGQWRPLWDDVKRVSERLIEVGTATPHFLGAVVIQQQPNSIGTLTVRTIIDGQQRLTTLQILLDAVHGQLAVNGQLDLAKQVQDLVENQAHFTKSHDDRFKVWPTNRDRAAFNEVMSAEHPINYAKLVNCSEKLVQAHEYFSREISAWLNEGDKSLRASSLVQTMTRYLQIVVIDLQVDEDAQEIFETLNARGTPLTAADLIKNFVFQRLDASPEEAEKAYLSYWNQFETPFWEHEVGRLQLSRSSLFLTQWLISQTREDIVAREVFTRFKFFVNESGEDVQSLLPKLRKIGDLYSDFTIGSTRSTGALSRIELFSYRLAALDSEVIKPLLLWLIDPDKDLVPEEQLHKAIESLESWLVRRSIVRASTKAYNKIVIEILSDLNKAPRTQSGDVVEAYLCRQSGVTSYWPSDEDIIREVTTQPLYKRLVRTRLRMIIEALEDKRRGFVSTVGGRLSETSVARAVTSIEHVMPQDWKTNWPGEDIDDRGVHRDVLVHMLGNLTLLTQSLNSKVSNAPWVEKAKAFREHTTLLLTADIVNSGLQNWSAENIHVRNLALAKDVLLIWPVPAQNKGLLESESRGVTTRVTLADLVHAGYLKPGQSIFARVQAHRGKEAFISEDGAIFIDGVRDDTPSGAAKKVTRSTAEDGWWFWVTDLDEGTSLMDVRRAYLEALEVDSDDDAEED